MILWVRLDSNPWGGRSRCPVTPFFIMKISTCFLEAFVNVAESYVGTREDGRNNGGPMVRLFMASTWFPGNHAWCAGFVCFCFKEAVKCFPSLSSIRPTTPRAFEFERWGVDHGFFVDASPSSVSPGDIVIFRHSHVGIAKRSLPDGSFECIEGNSNHSGSRDGGGVVVNRRSFSSVRSVVRLS